jgi:hypothetical protein
MEEEEAVQQKEEEEVQTKGEEEEVQAKEEVGIQPKCAVGEEEGVQRMTDEEVQTKKAKNTSDSGPSISFENRLHNRKGLGNTMDSNTKSRMEGAFGTTFNNVKIHTDSEASSMSNEIQAQAFTHGNDVFFNQGKYAPGTTKGDALLAHELTHTIQQKGAEKVDTNSNDQILEADAVNTQTSLLQRLIQGGKNAGKIILPKLKSGLKVSRCPQKKQAEKEPEKVSELELLKKGPKDEKVITLYVNGYSVQHLKQKLAKANILLSGIGSPAVSKKNPANNLSTQVYPLKLHITNFTDAATKKQISALFPGKEAFLIKKTHGTTKAKLYSIVDNYASGRPNNFSKLQLHNLLKTKADPNACIGTMNKGFENMYGTKTIEKGDMSDTAFGTIEKLEKKGMANTPFKIPAEYTGTDLPINYEDDAQLAKIKMKSIAATLKGKLKNLSDGGYVFAFSLANGYHSVTLIAYKKGESFEFMWKDQIRTKLFTDAQLDRKAKRYIGMNSRETFRKQYNKTNKTNISNVDLIPKGDEKYKKALGAALKTIAKDYKENVFALLKPE